MSNHEEQKMSNILKDADSQENKTNISEELPEELKDIVPELEGQIDEDLVLDELEESASLNHQQADSAAESVLELDMDDIDEEEYIDATEILSMLADIQGLLQDQNKQIRSLSREIKELRENSKGRSGSRFNGYKERERGGGGFRERSQRGRYEERDRYEDRYDRRPRYNRDDRGGRDGGFRRHRGDRDEFNDRDENRRFRREGNRDDNRGGRRGSGPRGRNSEQNDNFEDREFRPDHSTEFRPRVRADRGWSSRRNDESDDLE